MRIDLHSCAKCLGSLMTTTCNTGDRSQCCTELYCPAFRNDGNPFFVRCGDSKLF